MTDSIKIKNILQNITKTGVSNWKFIDQELINSFARITEDFNFIHICSEKAKNTIFKKPIVQGFLTLSLLSKFAQDILPKFNEEYITINYGFNKIRFMQPVLVNSSIRAKFNMSKYDNRLKNCVFVYYDVEVEIENIKKPALKASWIIAIKSV